MYIKYELYRAKNQELFDAEAIEWVLKTDKDLIEIDKRMIDVLTQHISNLPVIKKFGTAYIGRMKIVGIQINNNDDLGGLDEKQFRNYMADSEVMPYLPIKWCKSETIKDEEQKSIKNEPGGKKEDVNE